MLAFYVYIILGMDYDSFSPFGGDPHYATAERIVTNVQNWVTVPPAGDLPTAERTGTDTGLSENLSQPAGKTHAGCHA
jgi:hypothetical protein